MKWKLGLYRGYLSSILFGDTMVPNIDQDYILLLGMVSYTGNIILLGSTTKEDYSNVVTKNLDATLLYYSTIIPQVCGVEQCLSYPL